jgi:hypothetical protein
LTTLPRTPFCLQKICPLLCDKCVLFHQQARHCHIICNVAIAIAVAITVAVAVAIAIAVTIAITIAIAKAIAFTVAVAFAFAVAIAIAVAMAIAVAIGTGVRRTDFPLTLARSGPNIACTLVISDGIMGQLEIIFQATIPLKSPLLGLPIIACACCASFAFKSFLVVYKSAIFTLVAAPVLLVWPAIHSPCTLCNSMMTALRLDSSRPGLDSPCSSL